MKKVITVLCLAFAINIAFAQDLKTKKGEPILPEKGDWAIGIDAAPFITFVGNVFKGAASPTGGWEQNPSLPLSMTGKMFVDAQTAYRVRVRLGLYNQNFKNNVIQDGQADPTVTVQDKWKIRSHDITVGLGIEKRKGKTRLQGFYGGEAYLNYGGGGSKYEYGNGFSTTSTTPRSTSIDVTNSWTGLPGGGWIAIPTGARTLEINGGDHIQLGVRGFIGVEYFIFLKTSIGFEFGWGLKLFKSMQGITKTESWDGKEVKTTENKIAGSSNFSFDHENLWTGNSLNLTYHF
jgi:hypothetical protein